MFTAKQQPMIVLQVFAVFAVCINTIVPVHTAQFNYEVEKRVLDRLGYYLGDPIKTNEFINNFLQHGGFPNHLQAPDRDEYLTLAYSLSQPMVYYGLENGLFLAQFRSFGMYREPGNSGFDIHDENMKKYLTSCVNKETGQPELCLMKPGEPFIQWVDNETSLELCTPSKDDEELTPHDTMRQEVNCFLQNAKSLEDKEACSKKNSTKRQQQQQQQQKWCHRYTIETAVQLEVEAAAVGEVSTHNRSNTSIGTMGLGYLPMSSYCLDHHGRFSQELGTIVPTDGSWMEQGLGNCYFTDGITLVNRTIYGDYAYCQNHVNDTNYDNICANTFAGGFESNNYDPRFRPWYIDTKVLQKPNWSPVRFLRS